jgi:hypothetical protein
MSTPINAWQLTDPFTKNLPYLKIGKVVVEYDRPGRPGYLEVWLVRCTTDGTAYQEHTDVFGVYVKIENEEFTNLINIPNTFDSIAAVEPVIYQYLVSTGRIPAGQAVQIGG